jgi:hypothetical protein
VSRCINSERRRERVAINRSKDTGTADLAVAAKYPAGVACLASALAIQQLTTRIPGLPFKSLSLLEPDHPGIPIHLWMAFRYSPQTLSLGVEERVIDGVRVKVFGPEKTIADAFKFRNKIGPDAAEEALRAYAKRKDRQFDLVAKFAKACRVQKVIQP